MIVFSLRLGWGLVFLGCLAAVAGLLQGAWFTQDFDITCALILFVTVLGSAHHALTDKASKATRSGWLLVLLALEMPVIASYIMETLKAESATDLLNNTAPILLLAGIGLLMRYRVRVCHP